MRNKTKKSIQEFRLRVIADLGGRCVVCNEADPRILVLHHKNPDLKTHKDFLKDLEINLAINNIEIVCYNHHKQRHYEIKEKIKEEASLISTLVPGLGGKQAMKFIQEWKENHPNKPFPASS